MKTNRQSIYIETTIPSYATARASTDLIIAARQTITKIFWEDERQKYDLFISQDVLDECWRGDMEVARKRLALIDGIQILENTEETDRLAENYQKLLNIPARAKTDCAHLASCVVSKIDFLLSWNCSHLGLNAYIKAREYNERHGLWTPLLVTPEHFVDIPIGELE